MGYRSFVVVNIKQVASYKYLEAHINRELKCHTRVSSVCTRVLQHLHFLRRLRLFGVSSNIMLIFYKAKIGCVLRHAIIWFGRLMVKMKAQISNVMRVAL